MEEYLEQLLQWVSLHPLWAGVTVFLVAMAESLAIVGVLVPGVVMMFGIGALISTGALDFWPTFSWAVAGAVAGDGLSFFLGRYYKQQLRGVWPFSRHPQMLERGIGFFQRYGGKSIVFGRFVGPVRAVVPLVAGMMGMSPGRFLAANIASALAWAPAYLLPGMVFGASLELASEVALRLVVLLVLLLAILWFVTWAIRLLFRLLHPRASRGVQAILGWGRLHPRYGEIAAALADPTHPEAKGLALLASVLLLATTLFGLIFLAVTNGSGFDGIDHMVLDTLRSLRTPWADQLMLVCSRLADTAVILAVVLAVAGLLLVRGQHRTLLYWLAAAAFGLLAALALKYSLRIPRPEPVVPGLGPYAFPSGHMMRATVIYGFLSVVIARALDTRWRWLAYGGAGLLMTLVGLARLYLGAHWLSDVLGSLSLGLAWVAALGLAYHRHTWLEVRWVGISLCASTALLLATGLETWRLQGTDLARYTPAQERRDIPFLAWRRGDWRQLPSLRQDIRGSARHPLNIQYAGPLAALRSTLTDSGWQAATLLDWNNVLRLLSPSLPLKELPVLPQVHDGRHEALVLERYPSQDERLVLRLWSSGIRLQPGAIPLWLGNVGLQHKRERLALYAYPQTAPAFHRAYEALLPDLTGLPHWQPTQDRDLVLIGTTAK